MSVATEQEAVNALVAQADEPGTRDAIELYESAMAYYASAAHAQSYVSRVSASHSRV